MFRHDCPLAVKPVSTPWCLLPKQTCRYSLPIDIFLSAVSLLVVALPSLQIPKGLMNYPAVLLWPSTQQIPNKQTNVTVLIFVYYSVSATCFDTAVSSSDNDCHNSLIIELFLIWIHISNYININFFANFYVSLCY
jgi:hypothetical protein